MIRAAREIGSAHYHLGLIYLGRARAAVTILRGRGHILSVSIGDTTREYLAVERDR